MTKQTGETDLPEEIPSRSRPITGVPESFSQPPPQEAERLLTKYRRAVSDRNEGVYHFKISAPNLLPDEEFDTVLRLRKGVFKVIVERLKQRNIRSPLLTESALAWCLPVS